MQVETYGLAEDARTGRQREPGRRTHRVVSTPKCGTTAATWRTCHCPSRAATTCATRSPRWRWRTGTTSSRDWRPRCCTTFVGAGRRFEFIGEVGGVIVIDDYAHHPTEVAATLSAARLRYPTRRIWAVFQPHTYSRTQALLHDYAHSFDDADRVLLLDIYAAREKIDLGMHSRTAARSHQARGTQYVGSDRSRGRDLSCRRSSRTMWSSR